MRNTILIGDNRETLLTLPDQSVHCCVTSPPYWSLRSYLPDGHPDKDLEIGLQKTPEEFVADMVNVFREVRRVLRDDATLWLNLGDSYAANRGGTSMPAETLAGGISGRGDKVAKRGRESGYTPHRDPASHGLKHKDLVGIPWRVAFALQADGWYLRQEIIWHKPAPMPESVRDRCTKAHEHIFLLAKQPRYYYDAEAVKEEAHGQSGSYIGSKNQQGTLRKDVGVECETEWTFRNRRSVWTVNTQPFSGSAETSRLVRVALGALSGDTIHRVFEDCPIHGNLDRQCGEHEGQMSSRTSGSGDRPEQSQVPSVPSSTQCHATEIPDDDSDSARSECSQTAKRRSSGKNKKGRAQSTTIPCTPSVQTHTGTDDKSVQPALSVPCERIDGSKISEPDSTCSQVSETVRRSSDIQIVPELIGASVQSLSCKGCRCEFYQKETKKISHFATYPPALIEPCILAGTSAKGACPACGAPWVRIVERDRVKISDSPRYSDCTIGDGSPRNSDTPRMETSVHTTGWQPSCNCNAGDPIPCVVLDPFGGAGTTAIVAEGHGRDWILCELNPEYANDIAWPRIRQGWSPVTGKAKTPVADGQKSLF